MNNEEVFYVPPFVTLEGNSGKPTYVRFPDVDCLKRWAHYESPKKRPMAMNDENLTVTIATGVEVVKHTPETATKWMCEEYLESRLMAIRKLKNFLQCDLKTAKDLVDNYWAYRASQKEH